MRTLAKSHCNASPSQMRRWWNRSVFAANLTTVSMRALLLLAIAACNGSQSGSSDAALTIDALTCEVAPASADIAQTCGELATAYCERLSACSDTRMRMTWPDLATCEARHLLACTLELQSPVSAATSASMSACAAATAAQGCDAFLSGVQPPGECLPPHGTIGDGERCTFSSQCASGFCGLDEVCHTEPQDGEPCDVTGCGPTRVCARTGGPTSTCHTPTTNGECFSYIHEWAVCAKGYGCQIPAIGHTGTCEPLATTVGEYCGYNGPGCDADDGVVCQYQSDMRCAAIEFVGDGAWCGASSPKRCEGGTECSYAEICHAWAADCAACGNDAPCEYPARCRNGTCVLPR